jgi:hypothetical protein
MRLLRIDPLIASRRAGRGMTGVMPVLGGSMVLSGLRPLSGRITPSQRLRRSLNVLPGHVEPVEPGSCNWGLSEGPPRLDGTDVWASAGARLRGPMMRPTIKRCESLLMHCATGSPGWMLEDGPWHHRPVSGTGWVVCRSHAGWTLELARRFATQRPSSAMRLRAVQRQPDEVGAFRRSTFPHYLVGFPDSTKVGRFR